MKIVFSALLKDSGKLRLDFYLYNGPKEVIRRLTIGDPVDSKLTCIVDFTTVSVVSTNYEITVKTRRLLCFLLKSWI